MLWKYEYTIWKLDQNNIINLNHTSLMKIIFPHFILCYFVVVYDFLLLVFVELTNVNILLSSGREFMLLFLVYMIYALSKVHGNSNINMSTTEALKN